MGVKIIGSLSRNTSITGLINLSDKVEGNLYMPATEQIPSYTGETVITPKKDQAISLETAGKKVRDNIIVLEIPYYETSNVSGTTVYIGGL